MHISLPRAKKRVWLLTLAYRFFRPLLRPLGARRKMALLLDLEWIFWRLAHEESFRFFPKDEHPTLLATIAYLKDRLRPGSLVLDLGCGVGKVSFALASLGHRVVGIDHSRTSLEEARHTYQHEQLSFEHGDAVEFLKKDSRKFDVLVLSHVLEHLDDPVAFLRAFAGSFANVFIEVPDFEASYLNVYRVHSGARLTYTDDDHVTEFDREALFKTVSGAGLRVLHQETRFGVIRFWCERA